MRVLILNYEFPPLGGGYGEYHLLARELAKQGHEVLYVTSRMSGQPKSEVVDGISILRVPTIRRHRKSATVFEMFTYISSTAIKLPSITSEFEPDVCHIFFGIPTGALIFHPMLRNTPTVLTCLGSDVPHHNPDRFNLLYSILTPGVTRIWDRHDAVVANSSGLKDEIQDINPDQQVRVINNGIDTEQFHPVYEGEEGIIRFLYVGRLIELKRIDVAIKLLSKLNDLINKRVTLDIVGEGEQKLELKQFTREEGMSDCVKFHDYIPHDRIHTMYQKCDFYIQLSEAEGMPNTIMEAMACGAIPVVTPVGGTEELLGDDIGIFVPFGSEDNAVNQLVDMVQDDSTVRDQKEAARERIVNEFGRKKFASKYHSLYKEVIDQYANDN
ncbi:glycosyltransferase family 4 protein [Halosimplex halophilum]|uniref:glycosyltransferase family 4 protein n=1 Tax=Halosimplex halophilum TaxID=2559572 RepID=UPI001FE43D59|nr:glycosyltransferase family 4 protein [Halosimplex halophilum]